MADKNGTPAGRPKKEGLRKPQIRVLECLKKAAGSPMTRVQIAAKAPVDQAMCVSYLGSHDDSIRVANDAKNFPSLISLGLVKLVWEKGDEDSTFAAYIITKAGVKALETLAKAGAKAAGAATAAK